MRYEAIKIKYLIVSFNTDASTIKHLLFLLGRQRTQVFEIVPYIFIRVLLLKTLLIFQVASPLKKWDSGKFIKFTAFRLGGSFWVPVLLLELVKESTIFLAV